MNTAQTLRSAAVVGDLLGEVPVVSVCARGESWTPERGVHVEVSVHLKSWRDLAVLAARLGLGRGRRYDDAIVTAQTWCEELGGVLDVFAASPGSPSDTAALLAVLDGVAA